MNQEKPFVMTSGHEDIVKTAMVLRQFESISLKPLHSRALCEPQESTHCIQTTTSGLLAQQVDCIFPQRR